MNDFRKAFCWGGLFLGGFSPRTLSLDGIDAGVSFRVAFSLNGKFPGFFFFGGFMSGWHISG